MANTTNSLLRNRTVRGLNREKLAHEERIWKQYRGIFFNILKQFEELESHDVADRKRVWDRFRAIDTNFAQVEDPNLPEGAKKQRLEDIASLLKEVEGIIKDHRNNAKHELREDRVLNAMTRRMERINKQAERN